MPVKDKIKVAKSRPGIKSILEAEDIADGMIKVKTPRKEHQMHVGEITIAQAIEKVRDEYPTFTEFEYKTITYKKTGKKGEFIKRVDPPEKIEERWRKKKEHIRELSDNVGRLKNRITRDLKSENEKDFLTALAIAIMLRTGERVGNDDSAEYKKKSKNDKRKKAYGVTGFKKSHVTIIGNKVHLDYIGKKGVPQEKSFTDEKIAKALKKAIKNRKGEFIFETSDHNITSNQVNDYLREFNISAKAIRGYSANRWVLDKLKNTAPEESDKKRKKQLGVILKMVAAKVGHGPSVLKNQYLMPEVITSWIDKGEVFDIKEAGYVMNKGGKVDSEKVEGKSVKALLAPNGKPSVKTDKLTISERQDADKLDNGKEYVIKHESGAYLNFAETDEGAIFLEYVEVPMASKNQGIATKLLEHLFKYANNKKAYLDMTGFLDEGKKYLTNTIARLQEKYKDVEYSEQIKCADGKNTAFDPESLDIRYEKGGIPSRYKELGFSRVGQKKRSTRPQKKWMVLAKKGDKYKVVHGGQKGMEDFSQHHDRSRRKKFWNRMGGLRSKKSSDPFSPLYWHKRFGTWEEGGVLDDGTIKVAWVDSKTPDTMESKMFDSVEDALKYAKGKSFLIFELEDSHDDYYKWSLLPYGMYDKYKMALNWADSLNMMESGGKIEESEAFKKWFGDSKVIDESGRPLEVYHGTDAESFMVFDRSKTSANVSKFGFFFTDDLDFAKMFGGEVMRVYLSIQNPLVISQGRWNDIRLNHAKDEGYFVEWRKKLLRQGFDGLYVEESFEDFAGRKMRNPKIFAAFHPEQIKLADGSNKTFDPKNPDIRYQEGGTTRYRLGGLFHGSDRKFDKFSLKNVGAGGKSVGGWGIYLSTSKDVAAQYLLKSGTMYEVTVREDGDWLDLDEPIDGSIGDKIAKALEKKGFPDDQMDQFRNEFLGQGDGGYDPASGKQVYDYLASVLGDEKKASGFLLKIGIIGNRFMDKTMPEETNYVVFDADAIRIDDDNVERYENGGNLPENEDFASSKKLNNFVINPTKDEIEHVISGTRQVINGTAIQSASDYLRRSKSPSREIKDPELFKRQEAEHLGSYITNNNLWLSRSDFKKHIGEGGEQKVYFLDPKNVVKINSLAFYNSWEDYFASLLLHNYFFPATAYQLIGFIKEEGLLYSVVRQPLVEQDLAGSTDLGEVKKFMADNGFINNRRNDYYNPELGLILEDLHDENVLTENGILQFIDTVFYIGSKNGKKYGNGGLIDGLAFKKWFGDSKVVYSDGTPQKVYHGTGAKFNKFNIKKTAQGIFWFTSNKEDIEKGEVGAAGKGYIMELYASIQNPAGWDEYDKYGLGQLKGMGYDGVILPEKDGSFVGFVFDPKRLKSATSNRGTFDPNDSDIRHSDGGPIENDGNSSNNEDFANSEKSPIFTLTKITKEDVDQAIEGTRPVTNGTAIQAAIGYLRRGEGSIPTHRSPNLRGQDEEKLREYISKNNLWIPEPDPALKFGYGGEAEAYLYGNYVVKSNDAHFYDSWEGYLISLIIHNLFFPATSYELLGFYEYKDFDNRILYALVKQPYILTQDKTNLLEVRKFMYDLGFVNTGGKHYRNLQLGIDLKDLHEGNVLTKGNALYFIDTIFYRYDNKGEKSFEDGGKIISNITSIEKKRAQICYVEVASIGHDGKFRVKRNLRMYNPHRTEEQIDQDYNEIRSIVEKNSQVEITISEIAHYLKKINKENNIHLDREYIIEKASGITFKKLSDNLFLVTSDTQEKLAKLFVRPNSYLDSKEFKGKVFTLDQFKDWYTKEKGAFTYYRDYKGFNLPDSAIEAFLNGDFDPLSREEKWLMDNIRSAAPKKPYYVIGYVHVHGEEETRHHELAHALYYLSPTYRNEVDHIVDGFWKNISAKSLIRVREFLSTLQYDDSIWNDEMNAYLVADKDYLVEQRAWSEEFQEYRDRLEKIFEINYYKTFDKEFENSLDVRYEKGGKLSSIKLYHGTSLKHLPKIEAEGLVSNLGYSAGWYMLSSDFQSALFHANAINEGDDAIVVEFNIPISHNDRWKGYPYLWPGQERSDDSTWYAPMKPIPKDFIKKVHRVKYDNWIRQKSEGFNNGGSIPKSAKQQIDVYIKEGIFINSSDRPVVGSIPISRFNGPDADIHPNQLSVGHKGVEKWKKRIEAGERPYVLIDHVEYLNENRVKDAHHRLKAYEELGFAEIPVIDVNGKILNASRMSAGGSVDGDYKLWKRKNVTYRGMKEVGVANEVHGSLGNGLYTAPLSNKSMAKEYGTLYFVVNGRPKNPKKFKSLNEWEIWFYNNLVYNYSKAKGKEYPDKRDFNASTTIEDEVQKLGYDGIEIVGREMVNFTPPENVMYFRTEDELRDYYDRKVATMEEGGSIGGAKNPKSEIDRKVEELVNKLSKEDLKYIKDKYNEVVSEAIVDHEKKLNNLQSNKSILQKEIDALYEKEKGMEFGEEKRKLTETRRGINSKVALLDLEITHQQNIVRAISNGGELVTFTDKKGAEHKEIPYFVRIPTDLISFDEDTILTEKIPPYIPSIDEKTFASKGYVFDAIRIAPDQYMLAVNGYKEVRGGEILEYGHRSTIAPHHPSDAQQGYVIVSLDQLALVNDYYFTKAKATEIKKAEDSNIEQEKHYDKLPEATRAMYVNQRGFYHSLPAAIRKKITQPEFEAMSVSEKEKLYKPFARASVKRLASKLEDDQMWVSFHEMYERFVNPEALPFKKDKNDKNITIPLQPGESRVGMIGIFGNREVFDYWYEFRDMMKWKVLDIGVQREMDSEVRKIALETSFGESNTNDSLKKEYGILVKRQNGTAILPFEINQIRDAWIKVQKTFGPLSHNAAKDNLKISHTGVRLVFASKAAGVFIPDMKTIAVSNKFGNNQFEQIMSHEVAHWIDYGIGHLKGKRYSCDDFESTSGVIARTFRKNMNQASESKYINATKECFARAMEQYFAFENFGEEATLIQMVNKVEEIRAYHSEKDYVSKEKFNAIIKPLIKKFLSEQESFFKYSVEAESSGSMANGGKLLYAPNGSRSELTEEQWSIVRTPEFKRWFGDWEKDPKNSSKAVSEFTKEPEVYYHGSSDRNISIFDRKKSKSKENVIGQFIYFSKSKSYSSDPRFTGSEGRVYEVFLNIRNPLDLFSEVSQKDINKFFDYTGSSNRPESFRNWRGDYSSAFEEIMNENENPDFANAITKFGYDAISYHNGKDMMFAVVDSNQIKLADGTNKTFSKNSPDIRLERGSRIL